MKDAFLSLSKNGAPQSPLARGVQILMRQDRLSGALAGSGRASCMRRMSHWTLLCRIFRRGFPSTRSLGALIHPQLLKSIAQRPKADPEQLGRCGLVPARLLQGRQDFLPLHVIEIRV